MPESLSGRRPPSWTIAAWPTVGPGPRPSTTWAYDIASGRAVVLAADGAEITAAAAGITGRAVVRSAELIEAMRVPGHQLRYLNGHRPLGVEVPLPEHLHPYRDQFGNLSDDRADEIHAAGMCLSWTPFDPADRARVSHVFVASPVRARVGAR